MKKILLLAVVAVSIVSTNSFAEICQLTDGKRIAAADSTLNMTDLYIKEIPGKAYIDTNISNAQDCFAKAVQSAKTHTTKANPLAYTSWTFGDEIRPSTYSTSSSGNVPVPDNGSVDDKTSNGIVDAGTNPQSYAENDRRLYKDQQNLWACGVTLLADGNNVSVSDKVYTLAVYGIDKTDPQTKKTTSAVESAMNDCRTFAKTVLINFYQSDELAMPTHAHATIDDGFWSNTSHDTYVKGPLREKANAIAQKNAQIISEKVREEYKDISDVSTTK